MKRENEIHLRLSDDELAQLDKQRSPGMPRAVYLRSLIHRPPEITDVATREEALAILTAMARDGKATAAIAPVREVRADEENSGNGEDPLDALLRRAE